MAWSRASKTEDAARDYLRSTIASLERAMDRCLEDLRAMADACSLSLRSGGKVLVCGNGGSAADAQHLAAEFIGSLTVDHHRPAMPVIALTTDTSVLTAVANDFGADQMFARQVEALGLPVDTLICISTSGDSANILRAAEAGRRKGLFVAGLTGSSGGELVSRCDLVVRAPATATGHVQECHLAMEHVLAMLVERSLYPIAVERTEVS